MKADWHGAVFLGRWCLPALVVLLWSSLGLALGPIPGADRFAQAGDDERRAVAELGISKIDDDFYITISPRIDLAFGKIGMGLQVPINIGIPPSDDDYGGFVRRQDWDDPAEFLRVIRYVRYGYKRDTVYARVGELSAEIGHGTIMSRYLNNIDANRFHLGAQFDINTNYGGFETVVSDARSYLSDDSTDSKIVGARFYLKPGSLIAADSFLNRFAIGASAVVDANAPTVLDDAAAGDASDEDPTESIMVYGVDAEVSLLHNALLDLTPYTDLNFVKGGGWGLHAGFLATLKLPVGLFLRVPLRVEYRRFRPNYEPIYFSSSYEVERTAFATRDTAGVLSSAPKAVVVKGREGDGINGIYADTAFDFAGIFQVGAIYENYKGADPNLAAYLSVPSLEIVRLRAYYTRTQIEGFGDIFALDDRSLAIAEGRYAVYPFVDIIGRWTRRWALSNGGEFKSADDFNMGFELSLDF